MKELEELEARVAAKKARQKLAGDGASGCSAAQVDQLNDDFQSSLNLSSDETREQAVQPLQPSLASIFLVVLGLLSMMNQIYFRPTQSEWLLVNSQVILGNLLLF